MSNEERDRREHLHRYNNKNDLIDVIFDKESTLAEALNREDNLQLANKNLEDRLSKARAAHREEKKRLESSLEQAEQARVRASLKAAVYFGQLREQSGNQMVRRADAMAEMDNINRARQNYDFKAEGEVDSFCNEMGF